MANRLGVLKAVRQGWTLDSLGDDLLALCKWDLGVSATGVDIDSWRELRSGILPAATLTVRPTMTAGVLGTVPTFDGSNDVLSVAAIGRAVSGAEPSMVWSVCATDTSASRTAGGYGSSALRRQVGITNTSGTPRMVASDGVATLTDSLVLPVNTPTLLCGVFEPTVLSALRQGNATTTTAAITLNTGTDRFRIGANLSTSAAGFWDGPIAEFFVTRILSAKKMALVHAYCAARYPGLVLIFPGRHYAATIAGTSAVKPRLTLSTTAPTKEMAQFTNTNGLACLMEAINVDPNILQQIEWLTYRTATSSVITSQLEYVVSVFAADNTVVEEVIVATERDHGASEWGWRRAIFSASAHPAADFQWPVSAIGKRVKVALREAGATSHTTQIGIESAKLPLSTTPLLHSGTSPEFAYADFLTVLGYQGPLCRVERIVDGAQRDFWPRNDGSSDWWKPDVTMRRAWGGSSMLRYVTFYDQFGSRRHANLDNLADYPEVSFEGPVPACDGKQTPFLVSSGGGYAGGITRGQSNLSMAMQLTLTDPRHYQASARPLFTSVAGVNTPFRLGILIEEGEHGGDPGKSNVTAVRLDADALTIGTGLDQADQIPRLHAVDRIANGDTHTWLDDRKVTNVGMTSAGAWPNTTANRTMIGSFQGSWTWAAEWLAPYSDDLHATLMARQPDMSEYTADTWAFNPGRWSWYTSKYATFHNGILTATFGDRLSKQWVGQKIGRRTIVSGRATNLSDHVAPGHDFSPHDDRLFILYSGHGDEPSIHWRVSSDETVANLGVEQELGSTYAVYSAGTTYAIGERVSSGGLVFISLQSGNIGHAPTSFPDWWEFIGAEGDHEYARIMFHDGTKQLIAHSQKNDWQWGLWLNSDITQSTWAFGAYQPYCYATTTLYVMDDMADADTLGIVTYTTPTNGANSLRLLDLDFTTGVFWADGVNLGKWDGTAPGGKYLPVWYGDLPAAYVVDAQTSIRMYHVGRSSRGVLFGEWLRPVYPNWDSGTTYSAGDKVTYAGELWRSEVGANTNNAPAVGVWWDSIGNEGGATDDTTTSDLFMVTAGLDRFQPWSKGPAICSLGTTYDAENSRWGGACFASDPHTGIRIYVCRRDDAADQYVLEQKDSNDGGLTWITNELWRTFSILGNPVSPAGSDGSIAVGCLSTNGYENIANAAQKILWFASVAVSWE